MTAISPLRWPAEALWQAIDPILPGFTVEVLPQIDSTSSELMRRARAGLAAPTLLVAEEQTAGHGRLGRGWRSSGQASLTFSLGLALNPADWQGLSLAAGLAVAESLHEGIALKWPNDLWQQGRKLGGILIETTALPGGADAGGAGRYVVIGIGLNITPAQQVLQALTHEPDAPDAPDAPAVSGVPPAWLQSLLPGITAPAALERVALPLVRAVQAFAHVGFAPFEARFAARDALAGRTVRLSDGTQGQAEGVDATGALRVRTAAGVQRITSGEISVRLTTGA
ncbi:biotin--[acetyl-CoA-carboxylase] ligase [Ottowia massiliensis]|uniref:biotin--[acetyl-CoA-carboxylase] ligase n=1 Tax=Ottowia massiliensis TaxID=2045302 RepID=UPI000C85FC2F|nr:biotin--[acetyl-CoA-carboxylase] ligase [Ottowia massiliensis]